jgi:hypothetical protein
MAGAKARTQGKCGVKADTKANLAARRGWRLPGARTAEATAQMCRRVDQNPALSGALLPTRNQMVKT